VTRHEPLFPNALVVAAREYRERVRSRLFLISTLVLVGIAAGVALAPLAFRALERTEVSRILVVASEPQLATRTIASLEGVLDMPPEGVDPARWQPRYVVAREADPEVAIASVRDGRVDGAVVVTRSPDGRLTFDFHTRAQASSTVTQLVGFGTLAAAILDWQSLIPSDATGVFRPPAFNPLPVETPSEGGVPLDPTAAASRAFLALAFLVLIFVTLVIYGMWVATGVAAEKSSRVMEVMISAASPLQLLVGKVAGLGAAGLTQYVAILVPALLVLLAQERLATWLLGPADATGQPLVGLTLPLLGAFLLFFILGFALYALIYAAMGSLVSRPEDLQVVALPLSLVSMAGYLIAIGAIGGSIGPLVRIASYIPFWSPFVMLARVMVGRVEPWELGLSVSLLVVGIVAALWLAIRVYSAGVLLYGQRPGLRAFVAAARTPR
jgi:ABC-2 type transport system permease protein